jgi:hypothetical protein
MSINNAISFMGILFDILGAWFLARGLVKKPIEEIRRESVMSFFSYSYALGYIKQKAESTVGFLYLGLGFSMQALSYVFAQISNWNLFYIVFIVTMFLGLVIFIFGLKYRRCKYIEFILKVIKAESSNAKEIPIDNYQINKYLTLLNRRYIKEDLLQLFFKENPDIKNLSKEEKLLFDEKWETLHKILWNKLKDSIDCQG